MGVLGHVSEGGPGREGTAERDVALVRGHVHGRHRTLVHNRAHHRDREPVLNHLHHPDPVLDLVLEHLVVRGREDVGGHELLRAWDEPLVLGHDQNRVVEHLVPCVVEVGLVHGHDRGEVLVHHLLQVRRRLSAFIGVSQYIISSLIRSTFMVVVKCMVVVVVVISSRDRVLVDRR